MPYTTPTPSGPRANTYTIWAIHTNGAEVKIELGSQVSTEADADTAMQAALDLIAGSPDFTVTSAVKSAGYHAIITPTP